MTDIYLPTLPSSAAKTALDRDLTQALRYFQDGRLEQAYELCRRCLEADRGNAEALNLFGAIAVQSGEPAAAADLFAQAIEQNGGVAEYHLNLGNLLRDAGQHDEAILCFRRALALAPAALDGLYALAACLADSGRQAEAEPLFLALVAAGPHIADGYHRLGIGRLMGGHNHRARADFQRAIRLRADFTDAHTNLAILLRESGQFDTALRHFTLAMLLRPDDSAIQINMGKIYEETGRQDRLSKSLDYAVILAPDDADCYYSLAMGRTLTAADAHLAGLQRLESQISSLSPPARIKAHFALAKAYEDLGDPPKSFFHQRAGNSLKRHDIDYDEEASLNHFARISGVFSKSLVETLSAARRGDPSDLPVFVLGMPRSGSSLIEQILASHPQVFGAGELLDLPGLVRSHASEAGSRFPEMIPAMSAEDIGKLGTRYVEGLRARAPTATRIVDKLPDNFRLIGLIHLALPNAKIIHTRRNPIDSCLSIYSKLFTGDILYSYDLAEIGRYWRGYEAMMDHWRRTLPAASFLEVEYETLVEHQEEQTRRILDYCGLDWDEACLHFHRTDRIVRTASSLQVRRPIYKTSVGRWRPDPDMLAPLVAELERR